MAQCAKGNHLRTAMKKRAGRNQPALTQLKGALFKVGRVRSMKLLRKNKAFTKDEKRQMESCAKTIQRAANAFTSKNQQGLVEAICNMDRAYNQESHKRWMSALIGSTMVAKPKAHATFLTPMVHIVNYKLYVKKRKQINQCEQSAKNKIQHST